MAGSSDIDVRRVQEVSARQHSSPSHSPPTLERLYSCALGQCKIAVLNLDRMETLDIPLLLQALSASLRLLLWATPATTLWAVFVIWTARIVTLALLFRTYIAPNFIRVLSKRLRIRSISLRSVRGLYLRTGRAVYTVERIKLGWRWVSQAKTVRVTITVENLSVELLPAARRKKAQTAHLRRMPTLADLNPSPITPSISTLLSYVIRPAATSAARFLLRLVILVLPTLTQILEVELDNTRITSRPHLGTTVTFETAFLSSHLVFSQKDGPSSTSEVSSKADAPPTPPQEITSRWRFITGSGADRAWASTRALAKFSLKISEISCLSSPSLSQKTTDGEYSSYDHFPR
jgi:hypothetical protein